MRTNLLRNSAVAFGLGILGVQGAAVAQTPYAAPARWNSFRPVSDKMDATSKQTDSAAGVQNDYPELAAPAEELPAPIGQYQTAPAQNYSTPSYPSQSYSTAAPTNAPIGDGYSSSSASPYSQAVSSPWDGSGASCSSGACGIADGRPALFPYFGSANLLWLTLEEGHGRPVASGLDTPFDSSCLDDDGSLGFDISVGRYFHCNQFGLGLTYFGWNPGHQSHTAYGTAGNIRAAQPQYEHALLNFGGGALNVYDHIQGLTADSAGAISVRATRDIDFDGLELNLFSFGLMGGGRAAYAGCNNGLLDCNRGFTSAAGPLVRATNGRARIRTSHGIRWMRITDESALAYELDTTPAVDGITSRYIFDDIETENNLLGYQFGGMLTYCLGSRLDMNIGGKFGIYGNRAEMKTRLGTDIQAAYLTAGGVDDISTESSDTVLATLGELDLGLGFRVTNAWTVRGGYRLLGITGVANAVDSRTVAYGSLAGLGQVHADDSYLLHGGYAGLEFNW